MAGLDLQCVGERVAVVEDRPPATVGRVLALVGRHHVRLDLHRGGDAIDEVEREQVGGGQEVVLGQLALAGAQLARRQGGEGVRVAEHGERLPEGAHQVLALRQVHAGLAADRRVDHAEERGGHVHHRYAAVVRRGGEPRHVGDQSPADGDDHVSARQPPGRPRATQRLHRGQRLVRLAVGDLEAPVLPAGIDRQLDVGLGDDGRAGGAGRQDAGQLGPDPGADEHRVGAAAEGDLDRGHAVTWASWATTRSAMCSASACFGFSSRAWNGSTLTVMSATSS